MKFTILYDEPQEADWFKSLHPDLDGADEVPISDALKWPSVVDVLAYDRPDIVLLESGEPILVVEETVEVPSGHNVGQRFARIAAAAEQGVPCLYFGPYVARKHGGETEGPRFMNVRLFKAIDAMVRATGTAVTTICWHVDKHCEVRRDKEKDADVREYVAELLELHKQRGRGALNKAMLESRIHSRMLKERAEFVASSIRRAEQYDEPPESVKILSRPEFARVLGGAEKLDGLNFDEAVVYNVGMRNIRSDPYTGMAMLYHYLYIAEHPRRSLILWFPHVKIAAWVEAAKRPARKDIRLFKHTADAIWFKDDFRAKALL